MTKKATATEPTVASEPKTGTSMVPADDRNDALMTAIFGQLARKELNNFDGDQLQRWKLMSLATGPKCKSYDDIQGQAIDVKYFFVHRIEIESMNGGEIIETTRTVLIDKNGSAFAFVSDGVARDLARIIASFGMGPYVTPMKLTVESVKTRAGFKTYTLVPV